MPVRFHYVIISKSFMHLGTSEHLKKTDRTVRVLPWDHENYISFPVVDVSLNTLCDSCLEVVIKQRPIPLNSCCDRCRAIILKWEREKKNKRKKTKRRKTSSRKSLSRDKVIKANFTQIRKIATFLEPISELKINRNTIKISSKKNNYFCKNCVENMNRKHHLAHYCLWEHSWRGKSWTVPRICIRQMFLFDPMLLSVIGQSTYPLTWDKYFDASGAPVGNNLEKSLRYVKVSNKGTHSCRRKRLFRRFGKIIALIDIICHELAHHKTRDHGLAFQLKYKKLFDTMINELISGNYYKWC